MSVGRSFWRNGDRGSRDRSWGQIGGTGGARESRGIHSMGRKRALERGGGTGWITRVDQECLDGGLLSMWVAVNL